jgi:hypothetical protein
MRRRRGQASASGPRRWPRWRPRCSQRCSCGTRPGTGAPPIRAGRIRCGRHPPRGGGPGAASRASPGSRGRPPQINRGLCLQPAGGPDQAFVHRGNGGAGRTPATACRAQGRIGLLGPPSDVHGGPSKPEVFAVGVAWLAALGWNASPGRVSGPDRSSASQTIAPPVKIAAHHEKTVV